MSIESVLSREKLQEIARYTAQKIEGYPKSYGKTVANYFDVLYPNEVRDYIMRRDITRRGTANRAARIAEAEGIFV